MMEGLPPNALVILNLVNPKEKFWGVLLSISAVGITLRGINLESFNEWVLQVARKEKEETSLDLVTMFVPLFRVERLFLDEAVGSVKSYADYFEEMVGVPPGEFLSLYEVR
jgi:hypothetical protein